MQTIPQKLSDCRLVIVFAYGDVLSRSKLDLRSRQLATVAALTAMGNAPAQLKAHIKGALKVGCQKEGIMEVILQMPVYAGFPAILNGISISHEVFCDKITDSIRKSFSSD